MQHALQPTSILDRYHPARRFLPLLSLIALLATGGVGCGRRPDTDRFFDYGTGKVNLDRITYITPRIKVGIDDFPLTDAGIETVVGHLRNGRWSYFDVQAQIFFDEFVWRVFRSATFDKDDNPMTSDDIDSIERELRSALRRYQAIR